eukprot:TRINITY_DN17497_c0_g1_i2.p1 TRINITY_DN17497_c0_g1~~TRINITY_DN17497_c0_g1_i2.p1  ORF type:complete len:214 (+),score=27.60 TRINITY_DN17497_c0_g1_i2:65-643(+)
MAPLAKRCRVDVAFSSNNSVDNHTCCCGTRLHVVGVTPDGTSGVFEPSPIPVARKRTDDLTVLAPPSSELLGCEALPGWSAELAMHLGMGREAVLALAAPGRPAAVRLFEDVVQATRADYASCAQILGQTKCWGRPEERAYGRLRQWAAFADVLASVVDRAGWSRTACRRLSWRTFDRGIAEATLTRLMLAT